MRRVKPVRKPFGRSGLAANRQAGEHDCGRGEYAHAELHAENRVAVPIRRQTRMPRWLNYGFYPAPLLILLILEQLPMF